MNLKTSIKTGVRDVIRGTFWARPDIYLFMAAVYAVALLTAAWAFHQHGELPLGEAEMFMEATGRLVLLLAVFPLAVGVIGAGLIAILRRTRWAPKVRWPSEKYITVEEHEAKMRSLRDDVEQVAVEELRRELESQDGGDE